MGDLSPHFDRAEFACKCGCGFDSVDMELVKVLEEVREQFERPITVNSGCRCKQHNEYVGGVVKSWHLYGKAADIVVWGVYPEYVADYLEDVYPDKYGIGRYRTFTHVDVRENRARWRNGYSRAGPV